MTNSILSNELYIVSNDYINAYGQNVKNLAPAQDLSDAVNYEQLKSSIPYAFFTLGEWVWVAPNGLTNFSITSIQCDTDGNWDVTYTST